MISEHCRAIRCHALLIVQINVHHHSRPDLQANKTHFPIDTLHMCSAKIGDDVDLTSISPIDYQVDIRQACIAYNSCYKA